MTDSHLPEDLNRAIDDLLSDCDYAVYVLDCQTAATPGDDDDWHDALVQVFRDRPGDADGFIRFTRRPDGVIEYYYPHRPHSETFLYPRAETA